jgi:hypothetical protein
VWGFFFFFFSLICLVLGAFSIGEKGCVWVLVTNLDCHFLLGKIRVFVYYYYYFWVLEKGFSSLFNILFVVVVVVVVVVVSWQVMGGCW